MTLSSVFLGLSVVALVLAAAASALDLHQVERHTVVVYTTPALKDFIEKAAIPDYTKKTGIHVVAVYLSAGEEYSRVRMSRDRPEADLFVHASPLFIEKGYQDGVVQPHNVTLDLGLGNQSRPVPGGRIWQAFGWSPLVEVYRPGQGPVDLANDTGKVGFAHPLLSNNGIYNVLWFEELDPAAGRAALNRTVVQPVNAASTIGGVADGSYDIALGYEAVASLYKDKGAKIEDGLPIMHGKVVTTPVLFSVGLIKNHPNPAAESFMESLFSPAEQSKLAKYGMRPMLGNATQSKGLDVSKAEVLRYDWSHWATLESALPRYEVHV